MGMEVRQALALAVPEELARRVPRAFPFLERWDAVDEDGSVALGVLDAAPFARGEVVGDFAYPAWGDFQAV